MVRLLLIMLFPVFAISQSVTNRNPYDMQLTNSILKYQTEILMNSDNELVDLSEFIPEILLDIRYATINNFTNDTVYKLPKAFARRPVAEALAAVQKELRRHGMGLKIFDAYRPYETTLRFWALIGNTQYVASPWKGSRHNRGAAVDLTLITLKTGKEIEMPTGYDDFTEKASSDYTRLPEHLIANRSYLIKVMQKHGFRVFPTEWWHFDYKDWENYSLVDLSFEQLLAYKNNIN